MGETELMERNADTVWIKADREHLACAADGPTPARYQWTWQGASFDFYRLCEILGITHHAQAHALKKIIRAGRSVKTLDQDIDETIAALLRWRQMMAEDRAGEEPFRLFRSDPDLDTAARELAKRIAPACPQCGKSMIFVTATDFEGWSCMDTIGCVLHLPLANADAEARRK